MKLAANKSIREGTKIVFADGKSREVFPVSLSKMRKMMKVMKDIDQEATEMSEEQLAILLKAARIVLADIDPKLVEESKKAAEAREALFDQGKEDEAFDVEDPLEEVLDVRTVQQVLGAGMGTDPNL